MELEYLATWVFVVLLLLVMAGLVATLFKELFKTKKP